MRTAAQQAASRQNGKRSHGPTTAPGKSISRRNALKTGTTGKGIVLGDAMQAEVDNQRACFEELYKPRNAEEHQLVETVAIASIRVVHLMRTQHEIGLRRVRHALETHDAERHDRALTLLSELAIDPRHALNHLKRFTEGCDHLADAYDALAAELRDTGTLSADARQHARRLHGIVEGSYVHGEELRSFVQNLEALPALENVDASNPTAAAQAVLEQLEAQSEAWIEAGDELWQKRDEADREQAPNRAYFDPSPEAARLHRYLMRAERTFDQAMKALDARRRVIEPKPEPRRSAAAAPAPQPCPMPLPPHLPPPPPRGKNEPGAPVGKNEPKAPQAASVQAFERANGHHSTAVGYVDFCITPPAGGRS